ncbi:MAG: hypothetical protein R3293_28240 [Candidatus Promineifilaceae bacterium]|nr:hypothetical protein [Candidatus Promineifilaceae bacterium]
MKLARVILFVMVFMVMASGAAAMQDLAAHKGVSGGVAHGGHKSEANFQYELLKQTVTVWSDGRGDVILDRRLRNTGMPSWTETTWYFDWYPGIYSNIRAWDSNGPLPYSTDKVGSRIYVTVYFRRAIPIGQSYQFSLAITIGDMVDGSGDDWQANWYTYPAAPIGEFVQGVTLPSNATVQSVSPPPSTQESNYIEWRYTNTPADWEDTIDVRYTLSNATVVPLFLQNNKVLASPEAPWAGNPYGNYPAGDQVNTISRWGCNLTSYAMVINYWAAYHNLSFRTNPGDLNNWLRSNGGYDAGNGPVISKVLEYAKAKGVPLYNPSPKYVNHRDDTILDDYLRSGNPVIIGVGGHFVVATGKTSVNGVSTYVINDPIYGQTTLYEQHSNQYYSIRLLSGTSADQRSLRISAHSPVELLVTDPLGRRTGYDPQNNQYWNEIPDSSYFVEAIAAEGNPALGDWIESKILLIPPTVDGEYTIAVHGTGQGTYEIDTYAADWQGRVTSEVMHGQAQTGSVDEIKVDYNADAGLFVQYLHLPAIIGQ